MPNTKRLDPLDKLLSADNKIKSAKDYIDEKNNSNLRPEEEVVLLRTGDILNWKFHDRPSSELGDLDALAKDFINIGQQQPCIVRPSITKPNKYELIIGERRWRAAEIANIKLKAIIKNLSDHDSALAQAAENENRVDLSDWAKGMSFAKMISESLISQKDLEFKLGKTKQYISALLSYSKIPNKAYKAIEDFSNISASLSERIKQICGKSDEHINAIIALSPVLRKGKVGRERLNSLIEDQMNPSQKQSTDNSKKILTKTGRHIFTWRNDNNNLPSIHFPKQINNLMESGKLDTEKLTSDILMLIESNLENITKSPASRTQG
ncbi:ParB/RepB/Spo0J family partition protein [Francisellaceae bacterium]|nr:ParB/RepB/Spo0J family partition protein [Francisellaceae bacterium]